MGHRIICRTIRIAVVCAGVSYGIVRQFSHPVPTELGSSYYTFMSPEADRLEQADAAELLNDYERSVARDKLHQVLRECDEPGTLWDAVRSLGYVGDVSSIPEIKRVRDTRYWDKHNVFACAIDRIESRTVSGRVRKRAERVTTALDDWLCRQ